MEEPLKKSGQPQDTISIPTIDAPHPHQEGKLIHWMKNLLQSKGHDDDSLREAIEDLIDSQEEKPAQSAIAAHERRLISNILQLRDLPVLDVMVPRVDIVAISVDATKQELYDLLAQKPHSRIPVYKGDLDNIVGVLHMKDLIGKIAQNIDFSIAETMREASVVSPAMRVLDMLLQMRQSKDHMAFVVDEFGGIDGVITINDLIGAIVGEIDDDFDFELAPQVIDRPDGTVIVDGRFAIEHLEERFGDIFTIDEDDEDVDTIGGLVTYLAGHVPARGEIITHENGLEFEIIDADPRRILRLRIRNLPQSQQNAEQG